MNRIILGFIIFIFVASAVATVITVVVPSLSSQKNASGSSSGSSTIGPTYGSTSSPVQTTSAPPVQTSTPKRLFQNPSMQASPNPLVAPNFLSYTGTAGSSPFNKTNSTEPYMKSPSDLFRLYLQSDGYVVIYDTTTGEPIWRTPNSNSGNKFIVQIDGNLVLYDKNGVTVWSTGTVGFPYSELVLQDDGNLVLSGSNQALITFRGDYTKNKIWSSFAGSVY